MTKYNFKKYWKTRYSSLLSDQELIEREVKDMEENFVKHSVDESGNPTIEMPIIVHDDLRKYYAELDYLKRVIRIRKIWRPRDWWKAIMDCVLSCYSHIAHWQDTIQRRKVARLTDEQRISYYRKQVQKIERRLMSLFPDDTSDCSYSDFEPELFAETPKAIKDKAKALLAKRCYYLDMMFRATDVEIKRLDEVNDGLRQYTQLLKKQSEKWENREAQSFDDAWECDNEANLIWSPAEEGTVLPYEGDDFYGSNFERMIAIEKEVWCTSYLDACVKLQYYPNEEEEGTSSTSISGDMDAEHSDWKDGKWHRPEFEHIHFCYALHHMYDHLHLPMVDILHVNSYRVELKRENTLYLDITETHHPKGFGLYHRRQEYETAFEKMSQSQ